MYGILQLLQGFHLHNFPLKTLKLGWVAFYSLTFQLKCLDIQYHQYNNSIGYVVHYVFEKEKVHLPRSEGPLPISRRYPGYSCEILVNHGDVIEGRGFKLKFVFT